MQALRVLTIGSLALTLAGGLHAQKREDFIAIQRDVAQLQEQVRQLQKAQDEKIAALTALVQQSLTTQEKLAASLGQLQTSLTTTLNEQQSKVVAPMAALGVRVDQMADEFRSVRENVSELGGKLDRLDSKLADVSSAVRTLSAPPAAPPPPASADAGAPAPPPGVSAESLFENARRDYLGKHDDLAMQEFNDYLKYFPSTENAPRAQFYVGQIYDRASQHDDALQAFDAVIERFPEGPATADAFYWKAVELSKLNRRSDALAQFNEFVKKYPDDENVPRAKANIRSLSASPSRNSKKR